VGGLGKNTQLLYQVFLRIFIESDFATLGAEVDGLAFVFAGGHSLVGINHHLANWVDDFHNTSSYEPPIILPPARSLGDSEVVTGILVKGGLCSPGESKRAHLPKER
jgi:hypothetical protein